MEVTMSKLRIMLLLWLIVLTSSSSFSQLENKSQNTLKTGTKETMHSSTTNQNESTAIYFIDKFFVPKLSIGEFLKQKKYNKEYIAKLPGYIKGEAFEHYDDEDNLTVLTIAVWENQDRLNEAKVSVQTEFKRIGFIPTEFYQRLNIKMERGQYVSHQE